MSKEKYILIAIVVMLIATTCGTIILARHYKENLYLEAQKAVEEENWTVAMGKLEELGNYKNSKTLVENVGYHYYLKLGDEKYTSKEYATALNFYKKAELAKPDDEELNKKIAHINTVLENIKTENNKRKIEAEEKHQKEEKEKYEAKIKERQKKLKEIEPVIKRTFYKIDFLENKSLNARIYDFYISPDIWYGFNYDVKEDTFKLAVLYVQLKTNEQYEASEYLYSTKIRNSKNKSILAEYTAFGGIKTK